jgi:nitroreductase
MHVTQTIRSRRSVGRSEGDLSREEIAELIETATWAPNHHLTEPWTFTVITGGARERLGRFWGDVQADALKLEGDKREGYINGAVQKLLRAPVLIIVSTRTDPDPVVAAEDFAATAAAVQNLLLAATERGYSAMWRTGDMVYSDAVKKHLGLHESDRIVATIYLGKRGTKEPQPGQRKPPEIRWLDGSA